MTGPNWRTNVAADDWVGSVEKRIMHSERRPTIRTAAEILGPGIAPFAIEILDWDDDATAFNGFWFSQPGAINSPDPTNAKWYMGWSEGTEDGFGLQTATEFRDIPGDVWPSPAATWSRRFYDPGSAGTRAFSKWALVSDSRYIGEPMMWFSETPPNDRYLWANGASLLRASYPELNTAYAGASYPYGTVDSTHFNLPDMRTRALIGSDNANGRPPGTSDALAAAARSLRHQHPIVSATNHTHTAGSLAGQAASNTAIGGTSNRITNPITGDTGADGAHDHGGATTLDDPDSNPRLLWAFHVRARP